MSKKNTATEEINIESQSITEERREKENKNNSNDIKRNDKKFRITAKQIKRR